MKMKKRVNNPTRSEIQCSIGGSEQELSTSVIKNPELGPGAGVGTTLSRRKHITDFTDPARGTVTHTLYAETYKNTYKQEHKTF